MYFRESPKKRRPQGQDKWLNSGGRSTARDYAFALGGDEYVVRKRYGRINRTDGQSQLRFREFIFLSRETNGTSIENQNTVIFQASLCNNVAKSRRRHNSSQLSALRPHDYPIMTSLWTA